MLPTTNLNFKKKRSPFYLKTKYQNKSLLPVKSVINDLTGKPQIEVPNAPVLDEIFTNIFKITKTTRRKTPRSISNIRKRSASIAAQTPTLQNQKNFRQQKYAQLFCAPQYDTSNFDSLSMICGINEDGSAKISPKRQRWDADRCINNKTCVYKNIEELMKDENSFKTVCKENIKRLAIMNDFSSYYLGQKRKSALPRIVNSKEIEENKKIENRFRRKFDRNNKK